MEKDKNLDKFGRPYPPKAGKYYIPGLSTDAICVKSVNGVHQILLITRGGPTEHGKLALPGGFVEYNEDPVAGVLRELEEETNIKGSDPELLGVFGDPQRDSRRHVVTIAYVVKISPDAVPKGGDDASDAKFYSIDEVIQRKDIAFDHLDIIKMYISKFIHN